MQPGDAATWATVLVTLGIAIVGWGQAVRSGRLASTADARAEEALKLARSAEQRADRLERIQVERRDVSWKVVPLQPGTLCLENVGTDVAHNVRLTFDPDGDTSRRQVEELQIAPRGQILIEMPELAAAAATKAEERARNGIFLTGGVRGSARITWSSESGVQSAEAFEDLRF